MIVLSWFIAVGAVVLGALGTIKLVDPSPTSTMLNAIGVPGGNLAARLMGVLELLVAVVVLSGGPVVSVVALASMYFVFTAGLAVLRHRSPTTSCGCIGGRSGPPSYRHMAIDAMLGVTALAGALTATTAWPELPSTASTTAYWLLVMTGAVAVIAALSGPAAPAINKTNSSAPTDPTRQRS